jgi:hypothetical protein
MNAKLDVSMLTTLAGLNALERGPQPRRYAPDPAADEAAYAVSRFQRQCARDAAWRDMRSEEQELADRDDGVDALDYERFGEEQQGYHGDRR